MRYIVRALVALGYFVWVVIGFVVMGVVAVWERVRQK